MRCFLLFFVSFLFSNAVVVNSLKTPKEHKNQLTQFEFRRAIAKWQNPSPHLCKKSRFLITITVWDLILTLLHLECKKQFVRDEFFHLKSFHSGEQKTPALSLITTHIFNLSLPVNLQ
jgi:hypothetical protein